MCSVLRLAGVLLLASLAAIGPASAENLRDEPDVARGKDADSLRDPWSGFPVGSWIIQSDTMKQDGQIAHTRREKTMRIEASRTFPSVEGQAVLSILPERDGEFRDTGRTSLHVPGVVPARMEDSKLLSARTEMLEVGGRSYECEVKTWRVTRESEGAEATYTLWYADGLDIPYRELSLQGRDLAMPSDVLRADVEIKGPDFRETASLEVKSINEERKIGTRSLVCVREEGRLQTETQGRKFDISMKGWLSKDVPGHRILSVAKGMLTGRRVERRREVEEFYVVPARSTEQD